MIAREHDTERRDHAIETPVRERQALRVRDSIFDARHDVSRAVPGGGDQPRGDVDAGDSRPGAGD